MFSVLQSLGPKDAAARRRMDKRLGGGTAAMLAKLSCAQLQHSDKLLHSVRHSRFGFDLAAIRPYTFSLQAATSNGFSSFDELVRDALMLDAALGSNSGTPPPLPQDARAAFCLFMIRFHQLCTRYLFTADFAFPPDSRLARLRLGSRGIAGERPRAAASSPTLALVFVGMLTCVAAGRSDVSRLLAAAAALQPFAEQMRQISSRESAGTSEGLQDDFEK